MGNAHPTRLRAPEAVPPSCLIKWRQSILYASALRKVPPSWRVASWRIAPRASALRGLPTKNEHDSASAIRSARGSVPHITRPAHESDRCTGDAACTKQWWAMPTLPGYPPLAVRTEQDPVVQPSQKTPCQGDIGPQKKEPPDEPTTLDGITMLISLTIILLSLYRIHPATRCTCSGR